MSLQLIPYIMLDGNANEAIQFYGKSTLDAKVLFKQTVGEDPENPEFPIPANEKECVAHAVLKVGKTELMVSNTIPGQPHQKGNQVTQYSSKLHRGGFLKLFERTALFALLRKGRSSLPINLPG